MLKAAGFEEEGRTEYIRVYFREEDNMRVHISGTGIANTTVQRVSDKQTEMIALYRLD